MSQLIYSDERIFAISLGPGKGRQFTAGELKRLVLPVNIPWHKQFHRDLGKRIGRRNARPGKPNTLTATRDEILRELQELYRDSPEFLYMLRSGGFI